MPIVIDFGGTVKGDSNYDGYADWISVGSLQFGVGRGIGSTSGGGDRDTSAPSISEITLTKETDKASTALLKEALVGEAMTDMVVNFLQVQGGKHSSFLTMKFYEPIISGYSLSSGGDRPTESISINFTKFEVKYTQNKDGKTKIEGNNMAYDLRIGKVV